MTNFIQSTVCFAKTSLIIEVPKKRRLGTDGNYTQKKLLSDIIECSIVELKETIGKRYVAKMNTPRTLPASKCHHDQLTVGKDAEFC